MYIDINTPFGLELWRHLCSFVEKFAFRRSQQQLHCISLGTLGLLNRALLVVLLSVLLMFRRMF